ncbi:hypothetical protein [Allocoleopsis sp.]|uniref:hypothetical protein n=1 Tax=Allocoleopsis sp. TaxID=3088169 RepID=UPI002FD6F298
MAYSGGVDASVCTPYLKRTDTADEPEYGATQTSGLSRERGQGTDNGYLKTMLTKRYR